MILAIFVSLLVGYGLFKVIHAPEGSQTNFTHARNLTAYIAGISIIPKLGVFLMIPSGDNLTKIVVLFFIWGIIFLLGWVYGSWKNRKPNVTITHKPTKVNQISCNDKEESDIQEAKNTTVDNDFYLEATEEVESNNQKPALWAKAMAICEGDEGKAKYKYINFRVDELTNAAKQRATPPSIQISTPEHESKDTDAELSVLFLKEKGFKVTYKDGKWVFIDASGNGREFSTRGLVALANLKGDFHSFKEKKLAEINAHPEETPETKTHKEFSGDTQKQAQDAKKAINKLFDDATNTVVKGVSDKFNKS